MAAPSIAQVWNRALQLLGAQRVQSTSDTSKNALACRACYEPIRDKLLEMHIWRFALKQATLAADSPDPDWGRARSFTLPTDFMQLAPDYDEDQNERDWEIQDGKIFTDDIAPLYLRYVAKVTDVSKMSPTFRELLATEMAQAMAEELTQSNNKKLDMERKVAAAWAAARRANARQMKAPSPPEDPFLSARR